MRAHCRSPRCPSRHSARAGRGNRRLCSSMQLAAPTHRRIRPRLRNVSRRASERVGDRLVQVGPSSTGIAGLSGVEGTDTGCTGTGWLHRDWPHWLGQAASQHGPRQDCAGDKDRAGSKDCSSRAGLQQQGRTADMPAAGRLPWLASSLRRSDTPKPVCLSAAGLCRPRVSAVQLGCLHNGLRCVCMHVGSIGQTWLWGAWRLASSMASRRAWRPVQCAHSLPSCTRPPSNCTSTGAPIAHPRSIAQPPRLHITLEHGDLQAGKHAVAIHEAHSSN